MKQISIVVRRKEESNDLDIASSVKGFLMSKFGILDRDIDFHIRSFPNTNLNRLKNGGGYNESK